MFRFLRGEGTATLGGEFEGYVECFAWSFGSFGSPRWLGGDNHEGSDGVVKAGFCYSPRLND